MDDQSTKAFVNTLLQLFGYFPVAQTAFLVGTLASSEPFHTVGRVINHSYINPAARTSFRFVPLR